MAQESHRAGAPSIATAAVKSPPDASGLDGSHVALGSCHLPGRGGVIALAVAVIGLLLAVSAVLVGVHRAVRGGK